MEKIWHKAYPKDVPPQVDLSQYQSVADVFLKTCDRFRDSPAFSNMGKTLTFGEVEEGSLRFASYLQNVLGLKKGDRIAIQMPNLLQFPIAFYGAIRAGLIVVNTNPLYTPREMEHQFHDAGCKAIVILANFASHLESILANTSIETVIVTEIGDMLGFPKSLLVNSVVKYVKKMVPSYHLPHAISFMQALKEGDPSQFKPVSMEQEDIALLQYTGGTTGVSKGAMLTHRNIIANMEQVRLWVKPVLVEGKEVFIAALPLYHIFALTVNAMAFFALGGHNLLITNPRDLNDFVKQLSKIPFTVITGVNTLFNSLMNNKKFQDLDFSSLKMSVAGGMALQQAVCMRWREMTDSILIEGYGLTEASPVVCVNPTDGTDQVGSIGLPVPSTDVKLLDDEGREVTPGEAGELTVYGPQVMRGYWKRDDETQKIMTPDGGLRTGDIAIAQPDGFFKIVDRKKDMILVSGFNVYPNEVEDVIAGHPMVLEVAAVGVTDPKSGEIVKVFIVKRDEALTAEEVIRFARTKLAGYKVPHRVEFRKELPKTNVGKILRRELRSS